MDERERAARWARAAEAIEKRRNRVSKYITVHVSRGTNRVMPVTDGNEVGEKAVMDEGARSPWIANHQELQSRLQQEAMFTPEELLADAENWLEDHNVMNRKTCWVHRETRELTFEMPAAVRMKKDLGQADIKKRALDAKRKKMTKIAASFRGDI